MANKNNEEVRKVGSNLPPDSALGPLKLLQGKWRNLFPMRGDAPLPGSGWNMIALPFPEGRFGYRLLLNRYNEELDFKLVDKGVANRGNDKDQGGNGIDQFVAALDYEQTITQIAADEFVGENFPASGKTGEPGLAIHHEPGLFLYMPTETTNGINIARTASIPHGDSVMAFGKSSESTEKPDIEDIDGLPFPREGGNPVGIDDAYVAPYQHFHKKRFKDAFDPTQPNELLKTGIPDDVTIRQTTKLDFDTTINADVQHKIKKNETITIHAHGGILNLPFVVKHANATQMHSIFWIVETIDKKTKKERLFLQYSQTVFLDFLTDIWPHVSINTLEKIL